MTLMTPVPARFPARCRPRALSDPRSPTIFIHDGAPAAHADWLDPKQAQALAADPERTAFPGFRPRSLGRGR